jgi:hypothetical protein
MNGWPGRGRHDKAYSREIRLTGSFGDAKCGFILESPCGKTCQLNSRWRPAGVLYRICCSLIEPHERLHDL